MHGWSFNVECLAKIYVSKMSMDEEKMMRRLWGDNNFNVNMKIWTNVEQPEDCDKLLQRAFCQFTMGLIALWMRSIVNKDKEKYTEMMETLNILLKGDEKQLTGKTSIKRSIQTRIREADTLLAMIGHATPLAQKDAEASRREFAGGSHGRPCRERRSSVRQS